MLQEEFDCHVQERGFSRRDFVRTSVGSGLPMNSVAAMQEALASGSAAARKSKFVVFPEASHAFHADYRPSYRKPAADEGWSLALNWLETHGVA